MRAASGRPGAVAAIALAIGLYLLWVLATYLLEGRIHTILHPEAISSRQGSGAWDTRPSPW